MDDSSAAEALAGQLLPPVQHLQEHPGEAARTGRLKHDGLRRKAPYTLYSKYR